MRFKFIIKKWANFYFFVQNLAEWHFSCRKDYNKEWKKELGKFSEREKIALRKFKTIHLKYPYEKKYLGLPFFLNKNPWEKLKNVLTKAEFQTLQNVFSVFSGKFEYLYKRDFPFLKAWQKFLFEKVNRFPFNEKINKILASFYRAPQIKDEVKVYLLVSGEKFGGSANLDKKSIVLEISRYPIKKENLWQILGTIWHEIAHSWFETYFLEPSLKKILKNEKEKTAQNKIDAICEMTNRVLVHPEGILGEKFLKIPLEKERFSPKNLKIFLTWQNLVREYLKKHKPIDEAYIKKVLPLYSKIKKICYRLSLKK